MLAILQQDIIKYSTPNVIIMLTYFPQDLLNTIRYPKQRCKKYLDLWGQSLASGVATHLGTIVNYQGTHWVAIVLDFSTHTIWHGDSLGWDMDPEYGVSTAPRNSWTGCTQHIQPFSSTSYPAAEQAWPSRATLGYNGHSSTLPINVSLKMSSIQPSPRSTTMEILPGILACRLSTTQA